MPILVFMKLPASQNSQIFLEPLPHAPSSRPAAWICGFGGAKLSYTPDALAQTIVREWFPGEEPRVTSSMPGWSGMASYKVTRSDACLHMKVMIPELDGAERRPLPSPKQIESIVSEGRRAKWAGARQIAPAVVAIDEARGAYACAFIDGTLPTPEQARGKYLTSYLSTLKQLHDAPTDSLPQLSAGRNWLYDIDSASCLAKADAPRPENFQKDLLRLEAGLTSFLEKTPFPRVPVHGDLKLDNTLVAEKAYLIDWSNLHLDDAMTDLGCFFAMTDLPTRRFQTALSLYDALGSANASNSIDEDPTRLARLTANTALLRLKNCTFYDRWAGSKPKAEYLYQTLVNDLPLLNEGILREIGY